MKLAAIYTVWNGLELLEGSVRQILPYVDEVIIGYQTHSHYGVYSGEVEEFVKKFCRRHKKARAVFFKPKEEVAKQGERRKINILMQEAKKSGNTHFFISATDHYYVPEQFEKAKAMCLPYEVTATKMFTYFKNPQWRLTPMEDYYMPFICRLSTMAYCKDTKGEWNVKVDPALCVYPNSTFYEFKVRECVMHHYSFIRKDIKDKLMNAAARINFNDDIDSIIEDYNNFDGTGKIPYYKDHSIEVVQNYFDISL